LETSVLPLAFIFNGQAGTDHPAAYIEYIHAIKQHQPEAIALINPPIFARPPNLTQEHIGDRAALSSHYYDGLTMMGKRELPEHLCTGQQLTLQGDICSMPSVPAGFGEDKY
jgi:hypothetical protein